MPLLPSGRKSTRDGPRIVAGPLIWGWASSVEAVRMIAAVAATRNVDEAVER